MAVSNGKYLRKGHTIRETNTHIYTLPAAAHLKTCTYKFFKKKNKSTKKTFMIKTEKNKD